MGVFRDTMSSRYNRMDKHINSQRLVPLIGPAQSMLDGILALRRTREHGVPHPTKKLLAIICTGKEKTSFFQWRVTRYITSIPRSKPTLNELCAWGCVILLYSSIFCLCFLCFCFDFNFSFFLERENMKLGGQGCEVIGSIWEELRKGKALMKTYCTIFQNKKLKRYDPWQVTMLQRLSLPNACRGSIIWTQWLLKK